SASSPVPVIFTRSSEANVPVPIVQASAVTFRCWGTTGQRSYTAQAPSASREPPRRGLREVQVAVLGRELHARERRSQLAALLLRDRVEELDLEIVHVVHVLPDRDD